MGTNYYLRPIKTLEEYKEELIERVKNAEDVYSLKEVTEDYLEEVNDGIHLCKISCGWEVCFDHNNGAHYKPNRESLNSFLRKDPNMGIFDEYGDQYTIDEFWNKVDTHNSGSRSGEPLWDSNSYEEWEKKRNPNWKPYNFCNDRENVFEKFGIVTHGGDFHSDDGLRWATYTNFS